MAVRGNFPSRGKPVFIVTTITFVLATVFVAARLLSRFVILKKRTWDDWVIFLAWAIALGLSFAINYGAWNGLGRHDVNIPDDWLPALRRSEYAFTVLYNPALMATKTSILIFYLRMSENTQRFLRSTSYATLGLVNVEGLVMTFMNAFQCNPVMAAFTSASGKCMSVLTLYICSAPVNIVANLAILVLPIPLLTGMHLPQRQKTILVFTFSLGIFVTIVDVVRIHYLQKATDFQSGIQSSRLGEAHDFGWNASLSFLWSVIEVNVGIICACIPTLKPLVRCLLPSMILDPIRHATKSNSEETRRHLSGAVARRSSVVAPLAPTAVMNNGGDPVLEMEMMEFLTTPEMNAATLKAGMIRNHQAASTRRTSGHSSVYFGLIDMKSPKSMLKTRGMESFKYCTAVMILFFLWGFSYGLLNALNNEISMVNHETVAQKLGLSASYFVGYLIGPITLGQWVLRKHGFRATFVSGLCVYGVGTLMFWPSSVLSSWPGFLTCQFVAGCGLAILETAANPFVALCGPVQYSEYRLLLCQGVQAVGSVLSSIFAQKVLFTDVQPDSLLDVQWTYLAVTLVCVALALFFYYMPLPEASDAHLQQLSENLSISPSQKIFSGKLPLIYTTAFLAITCQFVYVAAQESNAVWFGPLLESLSPTSTFTITSKDYIIVGATLFALSRFIFAFLCLIIAPRLLLLSCFLFGILFSILTHTLQVSANGIAAPILMLYFFEGPIFPLIFAIGIRGMGRRTKWTASLIVAAVSGGSAFPFVMWFIEKHTSAQNAYWVIIILYVIGTLFPIYLTVVPSVRHQVDPAIASSLGDRRLDSDGGLNSRRVSNFFSTLWTRKDSQAPGTRQQGSHGSLLITMSENPSGSSGGGRFTSICGKRKGSNAAWVEQREDSESSPCPPRWNKD
ncbi:putative L-fucose permease [Calycina marina]|uniref:L-fucose permease n=1 Tax=Calycina marina TaxID=1763456 RepID=A0A9P8CIH6_9HELO|nr:putative L-fucose permease [Calycina marina]